MSAYAKENKDREKNNNPATIKTNSVEWKCTYLNQKNISKIKLA